MRIISGAHGGRRISPPTKMPYTRPTTDIAKEGLFNIIQNNLDIEALNCLDLFGGTGCISYELASRGAKQLTIVEKDTQMFDFIKKTSATLEIENMQCVKMDVFKYLEACSHQFDFIFAGPPYALKNIDDLPNIIYQKNMLTPEGWFVLEHTPRNAYESFPNFIRAKNYGTTIFSIFSPTK
jgi:16S rRNA (guanine(966)-N(2))-methyltransferase RsmD